MKKNGRGNYGFFFPRIKIVLFCWIGVVVMWKISFGWGGTKPDGGQVGSGCADIRTFHSGCGVRLSVKVVLILVFVSFQFFRRNRPAVDGAPCIDDVGQNERHKDGYVGHSIQCKLAGTAVGYRCRRLEEGSRNDQGTLQTLRLASAERARRSARCFGSSPWLI